MKPRAFAAALTVFCARNRWLVLGLGATAALVVLVVLSLTGVIGGGDTRRDAVATYIEQVNTTQRGLAIERDRVGKVYARARTDPQGLAGNVADLDRSAATLRRFDRRLRALEPPREAVKLHRRLVALSTAEAVFATEIARLGRYLPALTTERKAVGVAGVQLQRELAAKSKVTGRVAAQATAFDRFAAAVAAAAKPLQRAPVPAALEPIRTEEVARTTDLSVSARRLAKALRQGRSADARTLVQRFGEAAAGSGNAVERKAVIAFDAQARRIDALRLGVARERARLDRVLR